MKVFLVLLAVVGSTLGAQTVIGNRGLVGEITPQIVGGHDADIEDFPFLVSLQSYGSHICGGSIIAPNYVVTAAHCTDGMSASELSIKAGITRLSDDGQSVSVAKIHQHPKYSASNIDYDVSVLELESDLQLSARADLIALPLQGALVQPSTDAIVIGWGVTREGGSVSSWLQCVNVPIVSNTDCGNAYGGGSITDRMLCAGMPEGGKDACQGDSGGPLVINGRLMGIVSWGYGCARRGYPGIYTRVPAIRNYIHEVSNI